jgi:hypothetical protein
VKPNQLILLIENFIQQTKEVLKEKSIHSICDGELEIENIQLNIVEVILEDFKLWKIFIDKKKSAKST